MSEAVSNDLILRGYKRVTSGKVQSGDKYWDPKLLAWLPITVNDGREVAEFVAVIRKG